MTGLWWNRLGAGSGILYVLIALVALGDTTSPGWHATPQEVSAWARGYQLTSNAWMSLYVYLFALLFLLVFLAYLSRLLRQAEGNPGWLSASAFGAGLVTVMLLLAEFPLIAAAQVRAGEGFNPQILAVLWDMDSILFFLTWATQALLLAATGVVMIRAKALPGWLGWSAAVIALALLGTLPVAFFTHLPVHLLFLLWVLVASIVLVIRASKGAQPPQAPAVGMQPAALG